MTEQSLFPTGVASSSPLDRRDLLRVGAISLAGTALPTGLATAANAAPAGGTPVDSVIFLWMGGGVTHIDSFDPKPHAPEEIRGTLGAISTSLPGVQFGEPMQALAPLADQLCLVRSFSHDSNDHLLSQVYTLSGRKVGRNELFSEPNLGAVVSHLLGPRKGLPGYIAVPGITRPGPPPHNLFVGGWLGNEHAPFCLGGQPDQPDFTVGKKQDNPPPEHDEDLYPRELSYLPELTVGRISRRVSLRESLEQAARAAEETARHATVDGNYESALHLLTAPSVQEAFDLSSVPDATRERYGRTKIGGRCLMARRLVEAGARFVMVDYGYDPDYGNLWDIHNAASQNFPHVSKMCMRGYNLAGMDRAFAGLLTDLNERGLSERTLVVFLTEFGRTPKINSRGGRDHWGMCGSMFFAGGGVQAGQVIGETDAQAAWPLTPPHGPADIAATIYYALGINPETRIRDRENRPHPVLDHGRLIPGVLA
ncbi:DUF1501 domain-containing protein [Maioricimonas sp. JC845]|uniref:DUF1501 domain-containing protein n=1 Tax=Maioricimonas sp. JC845 TaxID=3232138 RepID=UPI00345ABD3A